MDKFVQVPAGVHNVPRWEEHCRKIHARAQDLIGGRLTLVQTAEAISRLSIWTLAKDDADLALFANMLRDSVGLPIGAERKYWSRAALERQAPLVQAWEDRWRPIGIAAALRLVEKYRWALAARQRRRRQGNVV
jgi:hypothetical protein